LKLRLKDYQAELQWKKFVNWEQLYKSKIWWNKEWPVFSSACSTGFCF
jgi:hypothetical protein